MKIYYMTSDNGDGSASTHFYKDGPGVEARLEAMIEGDPESYGGNEGGPGEFEITGEVTSPHFFSECGTDIEL